MTPCSACGKRNDRKGQRYCRACHSAYMRRWRVEWHKRFKVVPRRRASRSAQGI
jgi:hypothetical protein